ncbi:hypothetical protein IIA16_06110 [bacterium]|nr:hypothetical protein [bacterium]
MLIGVVAALGLTLLFNAWISTGEHDIRDAAEEFLAQVNGLDVWVLSGAPRDISGSGINLTAWPSSWGKAKSHLAFLEYHLAKYPAGLLESAGPDRIVVVASLYGNLGNTAGAVRRDVLYFRDSPRREDCAWLESTLHHELFHAMESSLADTIDGVEWASLNPPGFDYLGGASEGWRLGSETGANERIDEIESKIPGFFDLYSLSSAKEDRAQVFSALMSETRDALQRSEIDPNWAAKVTFLQRQLEALAPEVNEGYWRGLAAQDGEPQEDLVCDASWGRR